jgi:uncharacterized protein
VLPIALLVTHAIVINRFERGDWSYVWMSTRAAEPTRIVSATFFGAAAIGIPALVLISVGYLSIEPGVDGSSLHAAGIALWIIVPAALAEELLARGYVFALLRESWGWRPALFATSIGFGLLHMLNPGVNPQAIVNVILAGFFLGLVLLRFASLYAAWAAHAAWNLVLAVGLHTEVSGISIGPTPDYRVVDTGPDWLTGGPWGPEGGAAAALGLAVGCVILIRPLLKSGRATGTNYGTGNG